MAKNRIKAYWLSLLVLLYTASILLSIGETQARYENTVMSHTVVDSRVTGVTSNCLVTRQDVPLTVLVGELSLYRATTVPFWLSASGVDAAGKLAWGVSDPEHAEYLKVSMLSGYDVIEPNAELALLREVPLELSLVLTPTKLARDTVHEALKINVLVTWGEEMWGTFQVILPEVKGEDSGEEETGNASEDSTVESSDEDTELTQPEDGTQTPEGSVEDTEAGIDTEENGDQSETVTGEDTEEKTETSTDTETDASVTEDEKTETTTDTAEDQSTTEEEKPDTMTGTVEEQSTTKEEEKTDTTTDTVENQTTTEEGKADTTTGTVEEQSTTEEEKTDTTADTVENQTTTEEEKTGTTTGTEEEQSTTEEEKTDTTTDTVENQTTTEEGKADTTTGTEEEQSTTEEEKTDTTTDTVENQTTTEEEKTDTTKDTEEDQNTSGEEKTGTTTNPKEDQTTSDEEETGTTTDAEEDQTASDEEGSGTTTDTEQENPSDEGVTDSDTETGDQDTTEEGGTSQDGEGSNDDPENPEQDSQTGSDSETESDEEPVTEPETEPVVEVDPAELIRMETLPSFDPAGKLPIKISLTQEVTSIRIGLWTETEEAGDAVEGEAVQTSNVAPFRNYTKFSLNQGESYYMMYNGYIAEFALQEMTSLSLLLDFAHVGLNASQELVLAMEAYAGEELLTSCKLSTMPDASASELQAVVPTTAQIDSSTAGKILTRDNSLEFALPMEWKAAQAEYSVEMLTMTENQTLVYKPVNLESRAWKVEYTNDDSKHNLQLQIGETLPQAGTYRLIMNWSYEGICYAQSQTTFFINYSAQTDYLLGGSEVPEND